MLSQADLAISPGSVVLRTEVFELIQYKPTTDQVFLGLLRGANTGKMLVRLAPE